MARYANDTVAHIWASGNKDSGQSNNGQFYFEGRALYSYGRHYCAGYITEPGRVALLNSRKASITTARHMSYAWRATSHVTCHSVPELESIVQYLPADYPDRNLAKAAIQRHCSKHALNMTQEAIAYLFRLMGIRTKAATVQEAAQRAARKATAARDKATKGRLLDMARDIAAMTDSDIADLVSECRRNWRPIERFKSRGTELRRAHRVAKQAGRTAQAAKVWRVIKQLDAARHIAERQAERFKQRRHVSRQVNHLRSALQGAFDSRVSTTWANMARYARTIADSPWGGPARQSLATLAATAWTESGRLAAIEQVERLERKRAAREAWLNGESGYWRGNDGTGGALLRVRDDTLETSQGANVPLSHAIRIFEIARKCREAGRGIEPRARVGFYTVDRIDETGGFNAGCHRINWPEIERVARGLGLYP